LITGAADDDPSVIANYSQAGAQFGFNIAADVAAMAGALKLMIGGSAHRYVIGFGIVFVVTTIDI
jgi:Mn2+/Fe2+ NRAMP family transporter